MVKASLSGYLDPLELNLQQHVCLLQCGSLSGNQPLKWNLSELLPYATYLKNDQPVDRMFGGFIFNGITIRKDYYLNPLYAAFGKSAEIEDWTQWTEQLFEKGVNLHALSLTPNYSQAPYDIWISIPYPSPSQSQFGPLNGKFLDFQNDEDRFHAVSWWLIEFLKRWDQESHLHSRLSLRGFLWPREVMVKADERIIKEVNQFIHSKGYYSLWLANYGSNSVIDWEALGFDTIALNSNYYGNTHIDYQWINNCSNFAKVFHTGMQIIFGKGHIYNDYHHLDYLNLGLTGYQKYRDESFLVYDFPNQNLISIYDQRRIDYDRLYSFINGNYSKVDYPNIAY